MNRFQIIECIKKQLKYLKESGIEELMKENRVKEIEEIIQNGIDSGELDFDIVRLFCRVQNIELKKEQISKDELYAIVAYLCYSQIEDDEFFYEWRQFGWLLRDSGDKLLDRISFLMGKKNIKSYSMQQLLAD